MGCCLYSRSRGNLPAWVTCCTVLLLPTLSPCLSDLPEHTHDSNRLKMAFPDVGQSLIAPPWPWMGIPLNTPPERLLWSYFFPHLHVKPLGFVFRGSSPGIQWLQFDHLLFLPSAVVLWRDRILSLARRRGFSPGLRKPSFTFWWFCDIEGSGIQAPVTTHRASRSTWK